MGFQFINQALRDAERYQDNGGIDYMDAVLGSFTGRTMPPLTTADFVGLDVHQAIVNNLYAHTADWARDSFALPAFARDLIDGGRLGRKSGGGLYQVVKYENGLRRQTVYDISTGAYRDVIPYHFPFAEQMQQAIAEGDYQLAFTRLTRNQSPEARLCLAYLLRYMLYALFAAREAGGDMAAADDVMAAGFSWCPPLALYQALSSAADVPALIRERLPEVCERMDVDRALAEIRPSRYDYRRYFKSGRRME
ncbi:MAG: hypothetical protein IJ231_02185 [Clostridia bacterium]|nr:hypothetical protein [Clostridia bacterium]